MITKLLLDLYRDGQRIASAGTPVAILDPYTPIRIELADGREFIVSADMVSSGVDTPEETLSVLSEQSGIREDTLLKAAQTGRLLARKSGATWLSTLNAVEWAIGNKKIRK